MKISNYISPTKRWIITGIKVLVDKIEYSKNKSPEHYLNENTIVAAEAEFIYGNGYERIDLTDIFIERIKEEKVTYKNLNKWIYATAYSIIQQINMDREREAADWDFQREHEQIGGKYAHKHY